jgi:VTC domain
MKHILSTYDPITLAWLQAKSELMEREESKYLIHVKHLEQILNNLQDEYEILDIAWNREFTYENVYFDTDDYFFYHQHLNQDKSRTKIRTRKYVDSHLDFIEYKQKIGKVIKKERITIWEEDYGHTTPDTINFLESCFEKYYDQDKKFQLLPTLRNQYKRITLCHKTKKERVTIDMQISYSEPDTDKISLSLPHLAIIECKHAEKKPYFSELMKQQQIPEVSLCSKYCLWAYYLGKTQKYSSFLPTIIYIDTLKNTQGVSVNFVKDYQQRIKDNKRQTNQLVISG